MVKFEFSFSYFIVFWKMFPRFVKLHRRQLRGDAMSNRGSNPRLSPAPLIQLPELRRLPVVANDTENSGRRRRRGKCSLCKNRTNSQLKSGCLNVWVCLCSTHTRTEENVHGAVCLRGCEAAELMGSVDPVSSESPPGVRRLRHM